MSEQSFDLVVIGSGPGGYVAAIRGAQRGLKTALIEERELGGTCLNRGCIPSKALIANAEVLKKVRHAQHFGISVHDISFDYASMKTRKDGLVDKIRKGLTGLIASNKITIFRGRGRFISPCEVAVTGTDQAVLKTKQVILATGSEPRALPILPFDHQIVHDSTSMLNLTQLPKRLIVVGGGVIGCEFACLYRSLDVDVTVVELLPTILPMEGKAVSDIMTQSFKKKGIKVHTGARMTSVNKSAEGLTVCLEDGQILEADMALVSVGRSYNTQQIGLDTIGLLTAKDGSIPVDQHMRTNIPHIYAIGDITGKWLLAHVASHQGLVAADHAAGLESTMHYEAVPSVIFTDPEVGTIGYSLEKALEAGYEATVGKFPFQVLGKSLAILETDGFAQVILEKSTGRILGAQVVGHDASTLIAEMALAIENELTVQSVYHTIHAHPTLSEAWMEAALLADGLPLHLPPRSVSRD
ncbi:MAG: dihydrolipoyl dehydrogenase [Verrucomicrobia bacterium]|nr:dihydrolipoyl dehydrogenase [Verrucomicrobiota bacterium]MBS0646296.1 dihydrolipoyl dehydrogenase [Verrucomicrobiota bacterium]